MNVLTNKYRARANQKGFSIIELLVAIIIIGILVAVLIPIVSNRSEQARVARANADLENLSEALQRVAIDTGYYVRLFALNDLLFGNADITGSGGIGFNRGDTPIEFADGLTNYLPGVAQPYYQFPTNNSLFIDPRTGDFANRTRASIIVNLVAAESRYDATGIWGGPYLSFRSDNMLYNNVVEPTGIPTDPWGNDYILFTGRGMILEPNGTLVESVNVLASGGFGPGGAFDATVFDRPTVLSLGPNGLPGNGDAASTEGFFGRGDDFFRQF
ncbi:MAG: prepilin-type N-terminal cleavage/methylation domain-containing protein [Candidatus Sumerlaeia bacterium]|nr:prepilin-type N-terminal cleavage/methylation domain-containing protein [Candidatus Sumerlaeia bacterium]